jgi:hypothetical protein
MKSERSALTLSAFTLTLLAATTEASAFSTGGHFTATDRALKRSGFDVNGIRHVQASNYTVDHMANLKDIVMDEDRVPQRTKNICLYFHFDALHSSGLIEREFAFIDKGLRRIATDAKARRDPRMVLNALGIASHAVQDFYSHSNIADFDWFKWKGARIVTFDDLPRDVWESPGITDRWMDAGDVRRLLSGQSSSNVHFSAPEGNYPSHGAADKECTATTGHVVCGVNHDGAQRRNNLDAILMASEATFDLVERMKAYVGDAALWNQVQHPGESAATGVAWSRAQDESMGARQWGWESDSPNKYQVASAFLAYQFSAFATGLLQFDGSWEDVLRTMWLEAPTEHAIGGGADPFPAANQPTFGLLQPTPATATTGAPYIGGYNVLWGARRGGLDVVNGAQGGLAATLQIENTTYQQASIRLRPDKGLEIRLSSGAPARYFTGVFYLTGGNRDLVGYLRDAATGVPDGFAATRSQRGNVAPVIKPSVNAR